MKGSLSELAELDRARLMLARHQFGRALGAAEVVRDALAAVAGLLPEGSLCCVFCGRGLLSPAHNRIRVALRLFDVCGACWDSGVEIQEGRR